MKFHNTLFKISASFLVLSVLMVSCVEETSEKETPEEAPVQKEDAALAGSIVKFDGQIFSIPSPVQSAILMQNAEVEYNESLLNKLDNADGYISDNKRAMNLGVYGADLAYLTNFENQALSLQYFGAVQQLSEDLNMSNSLDPSLFKRFNDNVGNKDSLYALNSMIYQEINRYLRENDRQETAGLILAGGWVEAMHISLNEAAGDSTIRTRVGEQHSALRSLIAILSKFEDSAVVQVKDALSEMESVYQGIQRTYEYQSPITDAGERTTYINSRSSVNVTDEQLESLQGMVEKIRNTIIGQS